MNNKLTAQLKSLGFTDLESSLYIELLKSEIELTGYAIAKLVDKPAPNVYMALNSLTSKGALLVSENSKTKNYLAVPIEEYLAIVETSYKRVHSEILKTFENVIAKTNTKMFYNIESTDQAWTLAKKIILEAKKVLLIDTSFELLATIEGVIKSALENGIEVYIKTTKKGNIAGCKYIVPSMDSPRLSETPLRWIEISADSNHYLNVSFSGDLKEITSGIYCKGEQLGYKFHSGLAHEIMVSQLSEIIESSNNKSLKNQFLKLTHNLLWKAGTIEAFESTFKDKEKND